MKSASDRQGSLPSLFACWRRKWKRVEHLVRVVVRVQLDIVAHGVGGKEAVDAARRDQLLLDDRIEQRIGFGEDLARLLALLRVVEDARINALQLPGVEERRPVDELAQRGQRKVVQHAHAGERGRGQVFGAPLDRRASGAGGLKRNELAGAARRGPCAAPRIRRDAAPRTPPCRRRSAGWWSRARRGWHRARGPPARCSAAQS